MSVQVISEAAALLKEKAQARPKLKSLDRTEEKAQRQPLKQTQFVVPINTNLKKSLKETSQPLETIFGGKAKKRKVGGHGNLSPLRDDLNLTAEQLF